MKLVLLGTGTPAPSLKRASSSYLVDLGERVLVFDFGPGAYHRMMEAGYRATDITDLVFSHLHYDHCLDYGRLVMTRWDQGAGQIPDLKVYGPRHTTRMTGLLFGNDGVFGPDIEARTTHGPSLQVFESRGGHLPRRRPEPVVSEIGSGDMVEGDGWVLKTVSVPHAQPVLECLGFRLDTGERSLAYSGDSGPSRSFARLADGADVMIHMTYHISGTTGAEWTRGAAGHIEAAQVAADAGVRSLVVSHIADQMDQPGIRERLVTEMAAVFSGNIIWGEDLMVVPFDARKPVLHTG